MAKFQLGQVVATHEVVENESPLDIARVLANHEAGIWGNLCDEDKQMNEDAITNGDRILSSTA